MKKTVSILMSILMAMAFAAVSVTAPATVSAASAPGALYAYDEDGSSDSDWASEESEESEDYAYEDISEECRYFEITSNESHYDGYRFWPSPVDGTSTQYQMYDNGSGYRFYIDTNGGQLMTYVDGNYEIYYPDCRSSEKNEWTIDHWNTAADDSGEVFMPGEKVSMDTLEEIGTIYAIWKKSEPVQEDVTAQNDESEDIAGASDASPAEEQADAEQFPEEQNADAQNEPERVEDPDEEAGEADEADNTVENDDTAEQGEATVYVQGVELDDDHISGTGWSYDAASNTLTLGSFTYTGTGLFSAPEDSDEDDDTDAAETETEDDEDDEADEDEDADADEDEDDDAEAEEDAETEEGDDTEEGYDAEETVTDEQVKGVIYSDGDLTLKLNGVSNIFVIDMDSDASFGVNVEGELKVEGDGVLTVRSAKESKVFGEREETPAEQDGTVGEAADNEGVTNQNANRGDTKQTVTGGDNTQSAEGGDANASNVNTFGDLNNNINNYVSNYVSVNPYMVIDTAHPDMSAYRNTGCQKRPHEYRHMDDSPKTGDEDAAGLLGSLIAAAACIITALVVLVRRRILHI